MITEKINIDYKVSDIYSRESTIKALKEYKNSIIRNQEVNKKNLQEVVVYKSEEGIVKRKIKR